MKKHRLTLICLFAFVALLAAFGVTASAGSVKQTLTITADGCNRMYNGLASPGYENVSVEGNKVPVSDLEVTYYKDGSSVPDSQAPSSVGVYTVVLSVPASNTQYQGSVACTMTITKKPLDITGTTGKTKVYDGTVNGSVTLGTVDGILSGDDVKVVVASATFDNKNVEQDKPLSVVYGLIGADADNYEAPTETTVTADLVKATPALTGVSATALTYGNALGQATLSGTATVNGENVSGTWAFKSPDVKPTVADSGKTEYAVIFTPEDQTNLNVSETEIRVTVAPKTVTVTADDVSGTTSALPAFSAHVDGLLGTDTVQYRFREIDVAGAGKYRIEPTGEAQQGNYQVQYVAGTLTVIDDTPAGDLAPQTGDTTLPTLALAVFAVSAFAVTVRCRSLRRW